jgi:hypothetical protein
MASTIALPQIATNDRAVDTRARRLEVPIGGYGWGWGLLARWMIVFGLHAVTWFLPIWEIAPWYGTISDLGTRYMVDHFPIFPVHDGNLRFYQHFIPLVAAAIWLLLDRKRKHEVLLHEIARVIARYAAAGALSSYALEKTFGAQGTHTYVNYQGYVPPYGEVWRQYGVFIWLGHSIIYENFAAFVELVPIFLVPFRRLATLGALILFMACFNVYIVNTGHWDWGLSLTPIAFIAVPIVLLLPYTKRFTQYFLGRPVEPMVVGYLTPPRWYFWTGAAWKGIYIVMMLYLHNHFYFAGRQQWESPLGGIYKVESFTQNGKLEPMAAEYPERWREVAIGRYVQDITVARVDNTMFHATAVTGPLEGNGLESDSAASRWIRSTSTGDGDLHFKAVDKTGTMAFMAYLRDRSIRSARAYYDPDASFDLHYVHPSHDNVTVSGVVLGDTITAQLRRIPMDTMPFLRYRWYPEHWRGAFAGWMRRHGVIYPY